MAARQEEEGCYENDFFTCFLVRKGPSNDDVRQGWQGTPYQEIRPRAGFNTDDSVG